MNLTIQAYPLKRLKKLFDERKLAVPEVQREFVWDSKKICRLLDSLYKGYPIGSALIWTTTRRNKNQLREKLHILPAYDETNAEIWFIVDGQQRLSVLYHVLSGSGREVPNARGGWICFDRFYFYVGGGTDAEYFVYRSGRQPAGYVTVADVLNGRRQSGLGVRALGRMDDCRARLLRAPFFLQLMDADSLEDVRETFIRINAQGTPVTSADKAFARASTLHVRHLVRRLRENLQGDPFSNLRDEPILSALAFLLGAPDIAGRSWETTLTKAESGEIARKEFDRAWWRLERAVPAAIDYLRTRFGVHHPGFLPSDQILTLLSLYFAWKGPSRPSRQAAQRLQHWFWLTAVSQRYSGRGYRQHLSRDATFMKDLAERGTARLEVESLVPLRKLRDAEFSAGSALVRGYLCLLNLSQPRYLEDGEHIPVQVYASRANRPDKHHIFPKALLRRKGFTAAECNVLPNICYLVARENQSIGARPPHEYLEIGVVSRTKAVRARALESHLIPCVEASGLWDSDVVRGYKAFVRARAERIADELEGLAGERLFRRV